MKKYVRYILTAAAVLTAPGLAPLYAQTTDTVTRVPFGFTVGTASLPGDTYRLEKAAGHTDVFLIRSLHRGAIILGQPADASAADTSPRLVFHKYGDRYFLREVYLTGRTGLSLPRTRLEVDAAERLASGARPEVIVVRAGG
jgi:hypothetical protein